MISEQQEVLQINGDSADIMDGFVDPNDVSQDEKEGKQKRKSNSGW